MDDLAAQRMLLDLKETVEKAQKLIESPMSFEAFLNQPLTLQERMESQERARRDREEAEKEDKERTHFLYHGTDMGRKRERTF